jgi:hypothetical protein
VTAVAHRSRVARLYRVHPQGPGRMCWAGRDPHRTFRRANGPGLRSRSSWPTVTRRAILVSSQPPRGPARSSTRTCSRRWLRRVSRPPSRSRRPMPCGPPAGTGRLRVPDRGDPGAGRWAPVDWLVLFHLLDARIGITGPIDAHDHSTGSSGNSGSPPRGARRSSVDCVTADLLRVDRRGTLPGLRAFAARVGVRA